MPDRPLPADTRGVAGTGGTEGTGSGGTTGEKRDAVAVTGGHTGAVDASEGHTPREAKPDWDAAPENPDLPFAPDVPPDAHTPVDVSVDTRPDSGHAPYNCVRPVVPASKGMKGLVTDFTAWNASTKVWGVTSELDGTIVEYSGNGASMNPAMVEGSPVGLHLTGSMSAGGYLGGGLTFFECVSVAPFTQIKFDIYGAAPGSSLELQIQTYAQRPADMDPAGTCNPTGGTSCQHYPTVKNITDVDNRINNPRTVTQALGNFSNWSGTNVTEIVGLQWQVTGSTITSGTQYVDLTITNVRFIP